MTVDEHVEVGTKIFFRVLLVALGLWFLYLIRDVVFVIFLSVLASAALAPAVSRLRARGLSRTISVVVVYSLLFSGAVAAVSFLIPVFFEEVRAFASHLPLYVERLNSTLAILAEYLRPFGITVDRANLAADLSQGMGEGFTGVFSTTVGFFSSMISVLGFFFLSLYLSLEEKGIEKFFLLLTPERYHAHALSLASRIQGKVSQWLFGQMLLILIAFAMYYVGLLVLGVPYALAVAFFGGLMEIIPYIGPVLAAVPAIIVGFLVSPTLGMLSFLFYVIAHQIEAHIVAPQVMKRSADLSPVVLIVAILIGAKLGGVLGILIAVPGVMILSVFVEDFLEKRQMVKHVE
jgi:predicted PurR-regulated permease PerM